MRTKSLGVAIGVFAAVVAANGAGSVASAQFGEPIRVVSASHEIIFPEQVVFTVEAEADRTITEVSFYHRLGRQTINIYGDPTCAPANRVTADFVVKTSGANYVPPGTDIEYYYVIRDSIGNTFESERITVEYVDPQYDWQRLEQGDLIVLWHNRARDAIVDAAADVNERLREIKQVYGLDSVLPMKAVILNGRREASSSFPPVSATSDERNIFGGFAFGELDAFTLIGLGRDGMVHEMSHLLLEEAVDSPLAKIPAWLNEGLAMYFESNSSRRAATVTQAARRGDLLRLSSMGAVPGRPSDVTTFYAQAWSVVDYMMDAHGPQLMSGLLVSLNEGEPIERAMPITYGLTLDEIEAAWRGQLSDNSSIVSAPDPGTVGTSLLIGGAIAIAIIAVLYRWLRHLTDPSNPEDSEF